MERGWEDLTVEEEGAAAAQGDEGGQAKVPALNADWHRNGMQIRVCIRPLLREVPNNTHSTLCYPHNKPVRWGSKWVHPSNSDWPKEVQAALLLMLSDFLQPPAYSPLCRLLSWATSPFGGAGDVGRYMLLHGQQAGQFQRATKQVQ